MRRLAVMAHYDPTGSVGPHVRRQVDALRTIADDLVVVTTADLDEPGRAFLTARAHLVERDNVGYDFFSYKVGLEAAGDRTGYDEVVLCNDTYVGPLRPYERILAEMADDPADFWGLTRSEAIAPHVQSFFVVFRRAAHGSPAFTRFWDRMEPISGRYRVIRRYEVGMSRRLHAAGLVSAAYFRPTAADVALARRRVRWWAHRSAAAPRGTRTWRDLRERVATPFNPCIALADRALDDGRLPVVKIDTLRYDPYGLGAEELLRRCEERYPEAFEGVRDYLGRTRPHYAARPDSELRPAPWWLRATSPGVGYGS